MRKLQAYFQRIVNKGHKLFLTFWVWATFGGGQLKTWNWIWQYKLNTFT